MRSKYDVGLFHFVLALECRIAVALSYTMYPRPQNLAYRELRVVVSMGSAKNLVTTTYTIIGGGLDTRSGTYRGTARARLSCETY